MDFNELSGRKAAYALVVLFFAAAAVIAFQKSTLGDGDYSILIKSGISLESMKMYADALVIAIPLAVYLLAVYALKADEFHALVAALLLAAGGVSAASFFSVPPMLAVFFGKQYDLLQALKIAGAVLPLGLVAIAGYRKDAAAAALALLGAVALPFAPGISAILLALAASKGIRLLENEPYGDKALVLAVLVFAFQGIYQGDLTAALVASVLVAVISYVAVSLHNVKKEEVSALVLLFFAFSTVVMAYSINAAGATALQNSEIAAFRAAGNLTGQFAVLDYPNAFQYYSGKSASLLNATAIAKKGSNITGMVVLSGRSLDEAYAARPIVFSYAGSYVDNSNRAYAVFANSRYALYMRLLGGDLSVDDAQIYDTANGESSVIPFTKLRQFGQGNFTNASTRMINAQEIDGSALYSAMFRSTAVYAQNGTEITGAQ
ncbi:Uncharacterised protein [uncultured archaeon]|nr:Uncharacterised protein [uncultured archaeon]